MAVIGALEGRPVSDARVRTTFRAIHEAALLEGDQGGRGPPSGKKGRLSSSDRVPLRELLTGGRTQNFRRVCLAVVIQCFQQITGINIITYYATLLFERLQISDEKSRIIAACNATEYFMASFVAMALIDKIGRRKLMLFGSVGQTLTMVLLAVLGSIDRSGARIVSAVLLFVFNSFFAVGWLGMTWLYPAEIVGIRIRGPANALSTASNWTFNFLVVMITGPAFQNIQWRTYIVFAAFNFAIIPSVYFFFPGEGTSIFSKTAGRSLEDMDVIFAIAHKEGVSPVKVSFRKDLPKAGSPEAQRILEEVD
ncbi:hypothetical protein CVT24_004944 [Panaeolus cyanescens]|uniref:Major facilitator superfamily (MFS) profile domain-containing protein n=1 Tax=Panaeolus cyanescens TaxID=181874 RepID=A0A409V9M0_9AGAR|nr:hypothetical protein CVT24_004944 [Panaeolus cyanescens]